jgi:hypothetical protein
MAIGTKVSAAGHGALILIAIFGLPWFGPADREPIPVTSVSFVSEEAFEKAASAPADAPRTDEAPPVVPSPRPAAPEQPVESAPAEAPDMAPEEVATASPPPPAALETPATPERIVPKVVTLAPPTAAAPPRVRPAPTIAPQPTPAPPEEARPAEMPKPVTKPEPEVKTAKAEPPEALPEASPEAAELPEPPAPIAIATSSRPKSRPERVVEAKPVAAAKPKPEPAKEEDHGATQAAVLAAVKAAAKKPAATPAAKASQTAAATDGGGPAETSLPVGPPLTGSEKEGLKLAVQKCWNVPAGLRDAQSLKVTVGAEFAADGSVINASIHLIEPSPAPDARFQQAYEAARRALIRCAPYSMPRDKYAQWRDVEIVFNPEGMVTW